jgi:hypothetical protein
VLEYDAAHREEAEVLVHPAARKYRHEAGDEEEAQP